MCSQDKKIKRNQTKPGLKTFVVTAPLGGVELWKVFIFISRRKCN